MDDTLTLSAPLLLELLARVGTAIPTRTTIPVLRYVRISGDGDLLTVAATDLETTVITQAPHLTPIDAFLVPYRALRDALKGAKGIAVLTVADRLPGATTSNLSVEIRHGTSGSARTDATFGGMTVTLEAMDPEQYPALPDLPSSDARWAILDGPDLSRAIRQVMPAAAPLGETRTTLTFARLVPNGHTARLEATDGKRMHLAAIRASGLLTEEGLPLGSTPANGYWLSHRGAAALTCACGKAPPISVLLYQANGHSYWTTGMGPGGGITVIVRDPDSKYPSADALLNTFRPKALTTVGTTAFVALTKSVPAAQEGTGNNRGPVPVLLAWGRAPGDTYLTASMAGGKVTWDTSSPYQGGEVPHYAITWEGGQIPCAVTGPPRGNDGPPEDQYDDGEDHDGGDLPTVQPEYRYAGRTGMAFNPKCLREVATACALAPAREVTIATAGYLSLARFTIEGFTALVMPFHPGDAPRPPVVDAPVIGTATGTAHT